jgi:hypothetical protein
MSTIKISELATSNIALTDFFAKADATGVANKNTVQELSNLLKTVDDTAFKGSIAIADVPSENGWYFASESGTYTNCGGLVIDTSDNIAIIIISGTFDTFNKIDIPVNITIDAVPIEGSTNAIQSGGVYSYTRRDSLEKSSNTLNLANGANAISDGFNIPIGQTGDSSHWLVNPSLFAFDKTIKLGDSIKYEVEFNVTNYTEVTQPQVFQIIEQKYKDGAQISTSSAVSTNSESVNGTTLTKNISISHDITQSDLDNEYHYRFYVAFRNSNAVASTVNVTLESLAYLNDILFYTDIDRNKETISRRVLSPEFDIISVNRTSGRTILQLTIDANINQVDVEQRKLIKASGVFEVLGYSQFAIDPETGYYNAVDLEDFINLEGVNKNQTIIECTLPDNLGTSFPYELYQGVYIDSESDFKKFSVIFGTGRYALHIDGGFNGRLINTKQLVQDSLFWHKGNTGDALTRWGVGTAFGHGSNSGQITTLERCIFRNPSSGLFYHNNYDFANVSITKYIDCEVITDLGNNDGNVVIQNLGSGITDILEIKNTNITQSPFKLTYDNLSLTNLKADSADIEVVTDLEPRAVRNYDCVDMCLRIDSLSVGGGSYILLDVSSTAYNDILGDSSQGFQTLNRYGLIYRNGYSRKTGNQGLSGFAYGDYNIKENITQAKYVNSLGKRLGDCSTVNKVLSLNIDGVNYNITFDKNYNGTADTVIPNYTNAQILTEINTVIGGVALASEFKVAMEYYPKFKNVQVRTYEDSSEALRGYGVVFIENNKMRKALNSDNKIDGILLDDVATGETARLIIKGARINRMSSGAGLRFQINEVFGSPLPKPVGHESGISTTTAGLFDQSASPKLVRCFEKDVYKIL